MSIIALDWYYLDCSVTTDAHFGRASPLSFFSPLSSFFYFSRILENRMRGERGGGAVAPLSPAGGATGPPGACRLGPHVGAPLSVRAPLGHIKGRARPLEHSSSDCLETQLRIHSDAHWTQLQAHPGSSNTAYSGRRVLRSGGPNHSKPAVFIVFLSKIELGLANPRLLTLWA